MSLNLTSKQTTIKLGPHKGEDMYVMKVDHYSTLGAEKIIRYASETCGIPKAALRQAWEDFKITCCDRVGNDVRKDNILSIIVNVTSWNT